MISRPNCTIFHGLFVDINECAENNGGCPQLCKNTEGSFQCECDVGYMLTLDGKTCAGMESILVNIILDEQVEIHLLSSHKWKQIGFFLQM